VIGWLHGQVLHHHKDGAIVLDVHDVGYEVSVASQEDYRVGDVVDLYIFIAVRDDAKTIATIPGIGPKTASRIVLELKGKVVVPDSYVATKAPPQNDAIEDALRGLGYSTQEVRQALSGTTLSHDEGAALRQALQLLRRP
jgi:Holliday junction resolvasome RuvABC DNA-binding subunit